MSGSVFSKARYMNGVGFEILARTPVPQLPPSYPPPPGDPEGRIRVGEIRFASTGVICRNLYLVCKEV